MIIFLRGKKSFPLGPKDFSEAVENLFLVAFISFTELLTEKQDNIEKSDVRCSFVR